MRLLGALFRDEEPEPLQSVAQKRFFRFNWPTLSKAVDI